MQIDCSNIIENTVTKHTLQIPAYRRTHVMCQKIIRAVHIHRKSAQLVFIYSFSIYDLLPIHDER